MASSGSSWFKYGCFGCLALIAMTVLVVGLIAGIASMSVNSEEVIEQSFAPQLPEFAVVSTSSDEDPTETADSQAGVEPEIAGHVILKLSGAEFEVEPAKPGESLSVEAEYDRGSYRLTETLTEQDSGEWTYTVEFERTSGGGLMSAFQQLFGGSRANVSIFIPSDIPIALTVELSDGGGQLELGGLWLTELDGEFEKGGFFLNFDEPTRDPLQRLTLHGSMGGVALRKLGNASPRKIDVSLSMGGMDVDLRGHWRNDSDISLSQSMGGAALQLPHRARIEGLEGHSTLSGADSEVPMPTLRFSVSGDFDVQ